MKTNLLGAVPLLPLPLLFEQELEVVVGQNSRREGPGARVAGAVGVAAAQSVGTSKGNDLLIVEAHAVEDVAEVVLALSSIGETAIRSAGGDILILATRAEGDLGAHHFLDSADTTDDPEVRVGDPGEFGYQGKSVKVFNFDHFRRSRKAYP